jgi:hypothetical protein
LPLPAWTRHVAAWCCDRITPTLSRLPQRQRTRTARVHGAPGEAVPLQPKVPRSPWWLAENEALHHSYLHWW